MAEGSKQKNKAEWASLDCMRTCLKTNRVNKMAWVVRAEDVVQCVETVVEGKPASQSCLLAPVPAV